ncbi:MAG TPA: zinc dependent phospholipase C family protein [Clostridia bacterium]|nr:zinc dependent phospholipase C family protein [Clostridia bacterium]
MPYPATHLYFSRRVARELCIRDLPGFYLGSVAPDSVIFLPSWTSWDKHAAHLCVGEQRYEDVTNIEEWLRNALSKWELWRRGPDPSFYAGWFCHALLDLRHTESYVLPCKRDRAALIADGSFRRDMVMLDHALCPGVKAEVLPVLRQCAVREDGMDLFSAAQLREIVLNVGYRQYEKVPEGEMGPYAYIDPEQYVGFVHHIAREAIRYIS